MARCEECGGPDAAVIVGVPAMAGWEESWPLRSCLEFAALPGAVPCARLHVRQVVWEWGHREVCETVELLACELFTNAVRASPRGAVLTLRLLGDGRQVRVEVVDPSPARPEPACGADPLAESGRGLLLVHTLAQKWGSYPVDGGGKVVWCVVSVR